METRNESSTSGSPEKLGLAELYSKRIAPTSGWSDMGGSEHFVQFYESDSFIVNSIAEYVIHGLRSNETCVVVASRKHMAEVEKIVESFTDGLDAARVEQRYLPLDAEDTLSRLMVGDMPDAELFSTIVGTMIAEASGRGRKIRIFGEMVGLLCSRRNYAAAIRLEDFWNALREQYPFSLFCAYPMSELSTPSATQNMAQICSGHVRVIPDESYTSLSNADERLRAIAALQQKTKHLEAEVAELEKRIASKQVGLQTA